MSAALSRNPLRAFAAFAAVVALGRVVARRARRRARIDRDARALAKLPRHVLADMGLEKMDVMSGTNGAREIWIIPHRFR